jgi:predicted transcriptional regulator
MTPAELDLMRVLWQHGEQKPTEIQRHYGRPIKNAALRFQLRILLAKGHVTRRKVGKAYYYKAVASREGTLKRMVRRMAEVFSSGSTPDLIAQLIKVEKLDAGEIRELQRLARKPAERGRPPR